MCIYRRERGFTLIELLVVIGVIGVLAGLTIPAISSFGERSKKAGCMSNLQQFGSGILAYSTDFGGRIPGFNALRGSDTTALNQYQRFFFDSYMPGSAKMNVNDLTTKAFKCPSIFEKYLSYYSGVSTAVPNNRYEISSGISAQSGGGGANTVSSSISIVTHSENMAIFFCQSADAGTTSGADGQSIDRFPQFPHGASTSYFMTGSRSGGIASPFWADGTCNVLRLNGGVENFKIGPLMTLTAPLDQIRPVATTGLLNSSLPQSNTNPLITTFDERRFLPVTVGGAGGGTGWPNPYTGTPASDVLWPVRERYMSFWKGVY